MAEVSIEVGGRTHVVMCRDGEEERLRLLARMVDARAQDVFRAVGRANEGHALLLTALLLADDLDEAQSKGGEPGGGDRAAQAIEDAADRIERCAAALAAAGATP